MSAKAMDMNTLQKFALHTLKVGKLEVSNFSCNFNRALKTGLLAGSIFLSTVSVQALTASHAIAQEIQVTGPLANAPAVEHLRRYRDSRFEIAPTVSFTLLDEYRRTIMFGARLQYNVTDWLGLGVWGGFGGVSTTTNLTDQIDKVAPRGTAAGPNTRTATNLPNRPTAFADQTAKMQWVAAPQITLVPFRGKLSLFKTIFVDTDAYIHLGAAFVGLSERGTCGSKGEKLCSDQASFNPVSRVAIAPTFGLGLTFYPSKVVSFGFEYRALPFAWNRSGFDTRGGGSNGESPDQKITSDDRTFKFNQMVTIFVGFSIGDVKLSPGTDPKDLAATAASDRATADKK